MTAAMKPYSKSESSESSQSMMMFMLQMLTRIDYPQNNYFQKSSFKLYLISKTLSQICCEFNVIITFLFFTLQKWKVQMKGMRPPEARPPKAWPPWSSTGVNFISTGFLTLNSNSLPISLNLETVISANFNFLIEIFLRFCLL